MNGGSIEQELARIDAAIARVETLARPQSASAMHGDMPARHEAMKLAVSRTIAEIDSLIGDDRA